VEGKDRKEDWGNAWFDNLFCFLLRHCCIAGLSVSGPVVYGFKIRAKVGTRSVLFVYFCSLCAKIGIFVRILVGNREFWSLPWFGSRRPYFLFVGL